MKNSVVLFWMLVNGVNEMSRDAREPSRFFRTNLIQAVDLIPCSLEIVFCSRQLLKRLLIFFLNRLVPQTTLIHAQAYTGRITIKNCNSFINKQLLS